MKHGRIKLKVRQVFEQSGLTKNKFCQRAELQTAQLNRFLNDDVAQLNLDVLARICCVLNCEVSDVLEYKKEDEAEKEKTNP